VLLHEGEVRIKEQQTRIAALDDQLKQGLDPLLDSFRKAGVPMDDPTKLVAHLEQLTADLSLNAELKSQLEKYRKLIGSPDKAAELAGAYDKEKIPESPQQTLENRLAQVGKDKLADDSSDNPDPKTIVEAKSIIDRQKNALAYWERKEAEKGNGLTYPPCWARNNRPVYVYDATLLDNGLNLAVRDDRTGMDMSAFAANGAEPVLGQVISLGTFLSRTNGLFDWSVDQRCRFYVRIFDGTSADNKLGYQQARRTVEDHFYILRNE